MLKNRKKKGFTLVELIVVIAILGILAAVAIPRFSGTTEKARENSDKSTIASINNAIQVWCTENDKDDFVGASAVVDSETIIIKDEDSVDNVIKVLVANDLISSDTKLQTEGAKEMKYYKSSNSVK